MKSRNQAELAGGIAFHEEHAGEARLIFFRQIIGYLLIAAAVVLLILALTAALKPA